MVFITNVETISKTIQVCYSSSTTFSSRSNKLNIYGNLYYYCKNHYYLICHFQKQSSEDVLKKKKKKKKKRTLKKKKKKTEKGILKKTFRKMPVLQSSFNQVTGSLQLQFPPGKTPATA